MKHKTKRCPNCQRVISMRGFYKMASGKRYSQCKKCARQTRRAYYYAHLDIERIRSRVSGANWRAARYGRPGRITAGDVLHLLNMAHGRCMYCHADLADGWQLDHRIALSKPGSLNALPNLAIVCAECNQSKNTLTPVEFFQRRKLQAA